MARPTALTPDALDTAVAKLDGWTVVDTKLHADFEFADFAEAFGFMAAAATVAAQMDHHPEWSMVLSKVTVDLVTHDADGITELDVELAGRMSELRQLSGSLGRSVRHVVRAAGPGVSRRREAAGRR